MIIETSLKIKALCLLSGGLDSQLAVCVLRQQGVDVHGIVFDSPFFNVEPARKAAGQLGIHLHVIDFSSDILELIHDAPHGFGSCMNPCIDCHARMLYRAGQIMEENDFHFLATGEVLNQRPMSQNRRSLGEVERDSGRSGLIVRPLSAKLLPETIPEKNGWIKRELLQDIEGRSRKRQFELARRLGVKDYPSPAGGCRLTEPNFCKRLRDLKDHEGLHGIRSLELLRYGRHFRIADNLKMIVGRNEKDNVFLEGNSELYDLIISVEDVPGPVCLLPFTAHEDQIMLGASLCVRYSDHESDEPVAVRIRSARGIRRVMAVAAGNDQVESMRIGA